MALTGKTIGQLTLLTGITQDTLFAVEFSGITYHIPYSSITTQDVFITGGTYSSGTLGLTNNTGGTISITGLTTPPNYYYVGDSSINTNIDWNNGVIQELNLDDDPTLTFSNGVLGNHQVLLLKQILTGQRTITWGDNIIWNSGNTPTLSNVLGGGSFDNTFNIGTGFDNTPRFVFVLGDDKMFIGGSFTDYDGNSVNNFVKLNSDGTIDNTFVIGTGFNSDVFAIVQQNDNKIIVGGSFTTYGGNTTNNIVRLNTDGSIDNTFGIGTGFNGAINALGIQSDGKIIVGGGFTSYDSNSVNNIVRLNTDGSIDNTFTIGTGFDSNIFTLSIQIDDKIIAGGDFVDYDNNTTNRIVRLNSDGTIDNTFGIGNGFDGIVLTLNIQSDGKIVIGGVFTSYDINTVNRIVRLNSDGSIDNTFSIGTGFDSDVSVVKVQSDNRILVGGDFTDYDGNILSKIVRLNSNGTIDNTFNPGAGFDNNVFGIDLQSNGKAIIVGFFTDYDSNLVDKIVRIYSITIPSYNKLTFDYNGEYYIGSI
jgi:uncharacterized delta-60 repeat protein